MSLPAAKLALILHILNGWTPRHTRLHPASPSTLLGPAVVHHLATAWEACLITASKATAMCMSRCKLGPAQRMQLLS